ncbi:MAG: iron ABC transporter permease, partial [Arcobacteraceae bacterium]
MKFKYFIAPFIGISIALPILALILYFVFKSDFSFGLLNNQELLSYLKNTSLLTIGTFIAVVILGTLSAFLNARFEYTWSKFFGFAFILPLAYPAYIIGYTYVGFFEYRGILAELLNMNIKLDILNLSGAIFIFGISMYAYVYILARVSFASVSSTVAELISLQKMSSLKAFFMVYLPLAYPAIFAGSILAIMETLSDYGTVLYFGIDTFSVGIFKNWFGYGDLLGAINVAIVLLVFVFGILAVEARIRQKYRFVSSTHSGKKVEKVKLTGIKNLYAFGVSFLICTVALFIPSGVLVYWFILDIDTLDFEIFGFLYNTLSLNILSSAIIIFLSFLSVYFIRFYPSRLSQITHKISILG